MWKTYPWTTVWGEPFALYHLSSLLRQLHGTKICQDPDTLIDYSGKNRPSSEILSPVVVLDDLAEWIRDPKVAQLIG